MSQILVIFLKNRSNEIGSNEIGINEIRSNEIRSNEIRIRRALPVLKFEPMNYFNTN